MRANLRVALAARCAASILVPLALSVADSTAAILNVATTAELQSAIVNAQAGDTVVLAAGLVFGSRQEDGSWRIDAGTAYEVRDRQKLLPMARRGAARSEADVPLDTAIGRIQAVKKKP